MPKNMAVILEMIIYIWYSKHEETKEIFQYDHKSESQRGATLWLSCHLRLTKPRLVTG